MLYLGVDLGTSSMKVLLVDGKGNVLRSTSQAYPLMMPQPGWSEQDPEQWWAALTVCVPKLLEGIDGAQVAGLSVGGQMHGLVALDENDQVIRPAILWNDGRTGAQTDALNAYFGKEGRWLVLAHPKKLGCSKAGKCQIAGQRQQTFLAEMCIEGIGLGAGSAIVPQNCGTNDLIVLIKRNKAVHLTANGQTGHLCTVHSF